MAGKQKKDYDAELDFERETSMADEGGAAGAAYELQPGPLLSSPMMRKPPEKAVPNLNKARTKKARMDESGPFNESAPFDEKQPVYYHGSFLVTVLYAAVWGAVAYLGLRIVRRKVRARRVTEAPAAQQRAA